MTRKTVLLLCIILAVGLVLFVSRRTAQKPQPTMTAADATDSLATERITRDHGAWPKEAQHMANVAELTPLTRPADRHE